MRTLYVEVSNLHSTLSYRTGRQIRTEHGAETSNAVNVVIELNLSLTVTVALYERVERRVADTCTCNSSTIIPPACLTQLGPSHMCDKINEHKTIKTTATTTPFTVSHRAKRAELQTFRSYILSQGFARTTIKQNKFPGSCCGLFYFILSYLIAHVREPLLHNSVVLT